jgi:ABC-type transporter Mla subunit MlaD
MSRLIVIILAIIVLSSCSDDRRTIFLRADRVDGLSSESIVTVNGYEVGKVDDVRIDRDGEIVTQLRLDNDLQIPSDSKFTIENQNLFGSKSILVELGSSSNILSDGDTVMSSVNETLLQDAHISTLEDLISNLTGSKQRDSILYELRRLNQNLEELKAGKNYEDPRSTIHHSPL